VFEQHRTGGIFFWTPLSHGLPFPDRQPKLAASKQAIIVGRRLNSVARGSTHIGARKQA